VHFMTTSYYEHGGHMKKMWNRNGKHKAGLETRVLLGALVLAVVVGFGAGLSTAQAQTPKEPPPGQIKFFDPFRLTTISVPAPRVLPATARSGGSAAAPLPVGLTESNPGVVASGGVVVQSPVLIPVRPEIRSPYRPPWAPGKPPWAPGKPPWVPGPPF